MSNTVVRTNILSLNAHRRLSMAGARQTKSSVRLSSGLRVNSAADDAAGLAISEGMRAQIRGLSQAFRNVQDGISLIQVAEGAISTINDMIIRIRELVVKAANDTYSLSDRAKIQNEIDHIIQEIDSVSNRINFNTKILLNGDLARQVAPGQSNQIFGAGATSTLYGARMSSVSMLNNVLLQAAAQSVTFNPDFNVNLAINTAPNREIDIVWSITDSWSAAYDPDFVDFLRYELFETDGSVALTNMQRFVSTLEGAVRAELVEWELAEGIDMGSAYFAIDFDYQGRLFIGFTSNTHEFISIDAHGSPDPNCFAQVFFLGLFGGSGSSELTFTRAGSGGTSDTDEGGLWLQVGANSSQSLQIFIEAMDAETLGLRNGANILIDVVRVSGADISPLLNILDASLSHATSERASLGAMQNRLEFTMKNLSITRENLSASESRIRDAEMAKELMALTKANLLQHAAMSMLAQATQFSETVLQLLS